MNKTKKNKKKPHLRKGEAILKKIENEQIPRQRNYLMETTKYLEILQKASLSLI